MPPPGTTVETDDLYFPRDSTLDSLLETDTSSAKTRWTRGLRVFRKSSRQLIDVCFDSDFPVKHSESSVITEETTLQVAEHCGLVLELFDGLYWFIIDTVPPISGVDIESGAILLSVNGQSVARGACGDLGLLLSCRPLCLTVRNPRGNAGQLTLSQLRALNMAESIVCSHKSRTEHPETLNSSRDYSREGPLWDDTDVPTCSFGTDLSQMVPYLTSLVQLFGSLFERLLPATFEAVETEGGCFELGFLSWVIDQILADDFAADPSKSSRSDMNSLLIGCGVSGQRAIICAFLLSVTEKIQETDLDGLVAASLGPFQTRSPCSIAIAKQALEKFQVTT